MDKISYKKGIVDFIGKMSSNYRVHNARAVREDILAAIAYFDIEPEDFYSDEHDQVVARAAAELYRLTGKVDV